MTDARKTIVIGAGITGLSTAFSLKELGEEVTVLEETERPGGVIQSSRVDSFLFELGPNSLLKDDRDIDWFLDRLDLGSNVREASDRASRRYVVRNDRLHPVPTSIRSFFTSDLLSWQGKLQLLLEPFQKPGRLPDDETLASFVRRRLGEEALKYLVNPMVAGIYAGSPTRMSARSGAEKFVRWEQKYGGLLNGAVESKLAFTQESTEESNSRQLISFDEGMETLVRKLGNELDDRIRYGVRVEQIASKENGEGYVLRTRETGSESVNEMFAERVVVAVPAYTTANLIESMDSTAASALKEVAYPPVSVILFGYEQYSGNHPLDGFGFLVPEAEKRNILGTLWNASIFPDRAPEDGAVLTTFVGGTRQPDLAQRDRSEVISLVQRDLNDLIGLKSTPDCIRVKQWDRAIPQYELGHSGIMSEINRYEQEHKGLFIRGNYRSGVSVPACMKNGMTTAEQITEASMNHR